jgi:phosphoribulokinase
MIWLVGGIEIMPSPYRSIVFGVVGDSASGKTTLTRGLARLLGDEHCTLYCTDDYHRYDREERKERGISALHPDCNYIDIMELHLERLHYRQAILKPVYDHSNGTLTRPEYVQPKRFVIADGLLGFHTPTMRSFYDVKVFLKPQEDLRHVWKIRRDTSKRGYTPDQVRAELVKREPDAEAFIRPQESAADIVVSFFPPEDVPPEQTADKLNVKLILRPTIPHPDLSYLVDGASSGIRLTMARDHGLPVDILQVDAAISDDKADKICAAICDHMSDMHPVDMSSLGEYEVGNSTRRSHPLAITQLLIAYHLVRKYKDVKEMPFAAPSAALKRVRMATAPVDETANETR